MKRRLVLIGKIVLLIVVAGLVVAPLDASIQRDRKELRYGGKPMTVELRQLLGQGMAIAFLGGFRAIVADYLWVAMHAEFENRNLLRIPPVLQAVTWLQPQCDVFWDVGAWHLAYNLYHWALYDPNEPNPAVRRANAQNWLERGEQLLKDGIKNIPDRAVLYVALARLRDDPWKFDDPCLAAEFWKQSLDKKGRPAYAHRMVGYSLRRCAEKTSDPNKLREAFDWWLKLWLRPHDDPTEVWSAVRRETTVLKELLHISSQEETHLAQQEALVGIPWSERIFNRDERMLTQQEIRSAFNIWTWEWLRLRIGYPELWDTIKAKLLSLKERVQLSPEEEDRLAREEARLNVPEDQRIFKRLTPAPDKP